ncbi:MAG: hypothetical protein U0802_01470 [Candidatus Binatia bacterium]
MPDSKERHRPDRGQLRMLCVAAVEDPSPTRTPTATPVPSANDDDGCQIALSTASGTTGRPAGRAGAAPPAPPALTRRGGVIAPRCRATHTAATMQPGLSKRMLIGLVAGAALGVAANLLLGGSAWLDAITYLTEPVGRIFLRLLFHAGAAADRVGAGAWRRRAARPARARAHRAWRRSPTVFVSTIAVILGVALVNLIRPGDGLSPHLRDQLTARAARRRLLARSPPAPAASISSPSWCRAT